MFWNYFKGLAILTMFFGVLVLSINATLAEDVGDQYYPTAIEDRVLLENLEKEHQQKMQIVEDEYKKKMTALETHYGQKTANLEANTHKRIKLREKSATLKEERIKRREELETAFMKRQQELHKAEFAKSNQYVVNVKQRKEYFENKNQKDSDNSGYGESKVLQ